MSLSIETPPALNSAAAPLNGSLAAAIAARRTFAIISHPDAGKTTLTEKLLLYGNAIHLAGSVRARRNQRRATSDWMAIERERGISITSTVLQFPYDGHVFNLLDTPGHEDFSEDTYRTLAAVDSAVMVLDGAKGIEAQTRKLFEVCRRRDIPIFTFINKLDRPARDPLELLDEIETVLGMQPAPVNWPIGDGAAFRGVYDRSARGVFLYDRTVRNESIAPERFLALDDPGLAGHLDARELERLRGDVGLLDGLGIDFDHELVLAAAQTPVCFGSALTNFGVRLFLDGFRAYGPAPRPYPSDAGDIAPERPAFSGFVFKIQANMNPNHRDSVAFVRVVSGRFERDMSVRHPRGARSLRLPRPYRFFANEREVIEEAFPGDIIGLPGNGQFAIGDTLAAEGGFQFAPIPRFPPEHFALLRNTDIGKQKQFTRGLRQLETEGAMQVLYGADASQRHPILAVVGRLQFDVVQARLEQEYGVPTVVEPLAYKLARWVTGEPEELERLPWGHGLLRARDGQDRLVALFRSAFDLNYCLEKFPNVSYAETA
ncbi:MAG: peptide chain release factor 3 [Anaerolineales bacterium]|nr:peptide chain release factor 3 [Anaerolineales bacterium]